MLFIVSKFNKIPTNGFEHGIKLRLMQFKKKHDVDLYCTKTLFSLNVLKKIQLMLRSLITNKPYIYLRDATSVETNLAKYKYLYIDTVTQVKEDFFRCELPICYVNCHNDDIEYMLELSKVEKNIIRKILYKREARLLKNLYKSYLSKFDIKLLFLSNRDLLSFKNHLGLYDSNSLQVMPHWTMDFEKISQKVDSFVSENKYRKFFFIGSGDHSPNVEALEFIVSLTSKIKLDFHIIGPGWDKFFGNKNNHVIFDGFVEDLDKHITPNDVFVCPVYSGSGVNMKVIQAMDLGVNIILSEFSATPFSDDLKKYSELSLVKSIKNNELDPWIDALNELA